MRKLLPVVLLSLTLGACQSTSETAAEAEMGVLNKHCPMMPDHEIDEDATMTYNGYTIGFCCDGCVDKFDAWSTEKKDAFVTESLKAAGM